jgi:hypothetical protein
VAIDIYIYIVEWLTLISSEKKGAFIPYDGREVHVKVCNLCGGELSSTNETSFFL